MLAVYKFLRSIKGLENIECWKDNNSEEKAG